MCLLKSMDSINGESVNELLQAQAHVLNHIFNFINSMVLKCAVQLGIPDIIHSHGQPMTISELAAALPIHPTKASFVYRLMRILVHSGFFEVKVGDNDRRESYLLTQSSRLLLKDNPLSARPFLLGMLDPSLMDPYHFMTTWFQNDDPSPFIAVHGRTFWDFAANDTRFNHFFNEAMASDSSLVTKVVISKCKEAFHELNSLVDVGGGTGIVAKAIAETFPGLNCTILDLPHVVADLQGSENLNYHGGDMFEAIPPAEGILLKNILHDWNDEDCVKILKRSKEAIMNTGKGGKVIIIEVVLGDQNCSDQIIEAQLLVDLEMMTLVSGRERNEREWAKLFYDAGFSNYKTSPVLGIRTLIEVFP